MEPRWLFPMNDGGIEFMHVIKCNWRIDQESVGQPKALSF